MSNGRAYSIGNIYGIQKELNRFLDGLFPAQEKGTAEEPRPNAWRPVVDVQEDNQSYIIDVELPGLTKENVKINFQEGTLTLSGERKYQSASNVEGAEATEKTRHRMERFYGKFQRSFTFPTAVDPDRITAKFDNGILTITVPKAETIRPRSIDII